MNMNNFLITLLFSVNCLAVVNGNYEVQNMNTIDTKFVNFNGQKVSAVVPGLTTQDIDLTISGDDHFVNGAALILTGHCDADEIQFQVVTPTNVVAATFIDWFAKDMDKLIEYPAKVPATFKIRAKYKNTCTTPVTVRINYSLHKIIKNN